MKLTRLIVVLLALVTAIFAGCAKAPSYEKIGKILGESPRKPPSTITLECNMISNGSNFKHDMNSSCERKPPGDFVRNGYYSVSEMVERKGLNTKLYRVVDSYAGPYRYTGYLSGYSSGSITVGLWPEVKIHSAYQNWSR